MSTLVGGQDDTKERVPLCKRPGADDPGAAVRLDYRQAPDPLVPNSGLNANGLAERSNRREPRHGLRIGSPSNALQPPEGAATRVNSVA